MKERPILFSAPMVRALLAGSKTQTRRVCKPAATLSAVVAVQDPDELSIGQRPPYLTPGWFGDEDGEVQFYCPYGQPGDRLWVREAFDFLPSGGPDEPQACEIVYWAGGATEPRTAPNDYNPMIYGREKVRPGIHMPRWASRLLLEVVSVRVERLQAISETDALAEGIKIAVDSDTQAPLVRISGKFPPARYARQHGLAVAEYASLWETINGKGSWEANPWVWAVEFKTITPA